MTLGEAGERSRRGIPLGLALAVVVAAFPIVFCLAVGALGVLAGNDVSNSSSSFDGYGYSSSRSSTDDLDSFGGSTSEAGAIMAFIGAAGLIGVLAMAGGNQAGRVVTALWLAAVTIFILANADHFGPDNIALTYENGDRASGSAVPYLLLVVAPPIVALIGMFTPDANKVFRRS